MLIEWNDGLNLGLGAIDAQHRELAELLNRLEALVGIADPETLFGTLDQLYEQTRFHFGFEEEAMAQFDYPHLVEHRREHMMLLAELKVFIARVRKGAEPINETALLDLKKWLVAHILGNDRAFATAALAAGLRF